MCSRISVLLGVHLDLSKGWRPRWTPSWAYIVTQENFKTLLAFEVSFLAESSNNLKHGTTMAILKDWTPNRHLIENNCTPNYVHLQLYQYAFACASAQVHVNMCAHVLSIHPWRAFLQGLPHVHGCRWGRMCPSACASEVAAPQQASDDGQGLSTMFSSPARQFSAEEPIKS